MDLTSPNYLNGSLQFSPRTNSQTVTLTAGETGQVAYTLPLGGATIKLYVKNADGSLRPFKDPSLAANQTTAIPTGTMADNYYDSTWTQKPGTAALTEHQLNFVGLPGNYSVALSAMVPDPVTDVYSSTSFPPITIALRPPRPDGSCQSVCVDGVTGVQFDDDLLPPRLTVDALPTSAHQGELAISGFVIDQTPIAQITGVTAVQLGTPVPINDGTGSFTTTFSALAQIACDEGRITVAAQDGCGQTSLSQSFKLFSSDNAPVFPASTFDILAGHNTDLVVSGTDLDSDPLTYGCPTDADCATYLPTGATWSGATHTIHWAPTQEDVLSSPYSVKMFASDGCRSTQGDVTINVIGNHAPVLDAPGTHTQAENTTFSIQLTATDQDIPTPGDTLTFSAVSSMPSGATLTPSGAFSWTPGFNEHGTVTIPMRVTDAGGLSDDKDLLLIVTKVNRPPALAALTEHSLPEKQTVSFHVDATDPDLGDLVALTTGTLPPGATFTLDASSPAGSAGGTFAWTPDYTDAGVYSVTFTATDSDAAQATASQTVQLTVTNVNREPVITAPASTLAATEDQLFTLVFTGSDADLPVTQKDAPRSDVLTWSLVSGLPAGASFGLDTHASTWMLSWTPTFAQAGDYDVTVELADDKGGSTTATRRIHVHDVNRAPQPTGPATGHGVEHEWLYVSYAVTDPDSDPTTCTMAGLPTGATFEAEARLLSWLPTYDQSTPQTGLAPLVTLTCCDHPREVDSGLDLCTSMQTQLTIDELNRPCVLDPIPPQVVLEEATLTFVVHGQDPDVESQLVYGATDLPIGAAFDANTQTFTWTPTLTQAGDYEALFSVTDGEFIDRERARIHVLNRNRAPELTPRPADLVAAGSSLTFRVDAVDPDGDFWSCTATNLPANSSFDPASRLFRFNPVDTDVGARGLDAECCDQPGFPESASLCGQRHFELTVVAAQVNAPPVLDPAGPFTVYEGDPVAFPIAARDPENDPLTCSAAFVPPRAAFDTIGRQFGWLTQSGDAGDYALEVSCTDKTTSVTTTVLIHVLKSDYERVGGGVATLGCSTAGPQTATGWLALFGLLFAFRMALLRRARLLRAPARALSGVLLLALLTTACTTTPATALPPVGHASITGQATFSNAADSAGIQAILSGPGSAATLTAADGSYSFTGLFAGNYVVKLSSADALEPVQVVAITLQDAQAATATPVVLTAVGSATGKVLLAGGQGFAMGASVVAPGTRGVALVDANGTYTLRELPAGTVDVLATLDGQGQASVRSALITRGQTTPLADLVLAQGPTGTLAISGSLGIGSVTSLGGYGISLQGPRSASTVTAADGSFAFSGLGDGSYVLTAVVRSSLEIAVSLPVELSGQSKTAQDLRFSPTGTVTGKATFGTATGNAAIGISVLGTLSVTFTDAQGNYSLKGVPAGIQAVIASYPGRTRATVDAVVPFDGTVAASDLLLSAVGSRGRIEGKATLLGLEANANGGLQVLLFGTSSVQRSTDLTGAFAFTELSDGTYLVEATAPSTSEGVQRRSVTLTNGAAQLGVDFAFQPVGVVEGFATLNGVPAPGVLVYALGTSHTTLTDVRGHFTLGNLLAYTNVRLQATTGSALSQIATPPGVLYADTVQSEELKLVQQSGIDLLASNVALVDPDVGATLTASARQHSGSGAGFFSGDTVVSGPVDSAGNYSLSVQDGFWELSFGIDAGPGMGAWQETLPVTAALPGGTGFVWDREVSPLSPLHLQYGRRAVSTPSVGGLKLNASPSANPMPVCSKPIPRAQARGQVTGMAAAGQEAKYNGNAPLTGDLLYLADYQCTSTAIGFTLLACGGALHFASQGTDALLHAAPIWANTYSLGPVGTHTALFATGAVSSQMQLFIARADGTRAQLSDAFDLNSGSLSSMGGTQVAFFTNSIDDPVLGKIATLKIVDANTFTITTLATDAALSTVLVAPDGQHVWYARSTQSASGLVSVIHVAEVATCTTPGCGVDVPDAQLTGLTFSSDGKAVLWLNPTGCIWMLGDANGTNQLQVSAEYSVSVLQPKNGLDLLLFTWWTSDVAGVWQHQGIRSFLPVPAGGEFVERELGMGANVDVQLSKDKTMLTSVVLPDPALALPTLFVTPATVSGTMTQMATLVDAWALSGTHFLLTRDTAAIGGGQLVVAKADTGAATVVEPSGMMPSADPAGALWMSTGHAVYTLRPSTPNLTTLTPGNGDLVRVVSFATSAPTTLIDGQTASDATFSLDDTLVAVMAVDGSLWVSRTNGTSTAMMSPASAGGYLGDRSGFLTDGTLIGYGPTSWAWRLGASNTKTLDLDLHTTGGHFVAADRSGAFLVLPPADGDDRVLSIGVFKAGSDAPRLVLERVEQATGEWAPDYNTMLLRADMVFAWPAAKASDSGTLVLLKADGSKLKILESASSNFLFYGDSYEFGVHANGPAPYGWLQDGPYLSSPPWAMGPPYTPLY